MDKLTATFKLETYTDDEYGVDAPTELKVDLNRKDCKRFIELSESVKNLGAHRISDFDFSPIYYNDEEPVRMDYCLVQVSKDDVTWDSVIKHTSIRIDADSIPIKKIADCLKVFDASNSELPTILKDDMCEEAKDLLTKRLKGD